MSHAIALGGTAAPALGVCTIQSKGKAHPFTYFMEREWLVRSVLEGRYRHPRKPQDDKVRRVLDIGANCGEFMVHCWVTWPGCWVDWVEEDEPLATMCAGNAIPGARRVTLEECVGAYDVVRIAMSGCSPVFQSGLILTIVDTMWYP